MTKACLSVIFLLCAASADTRPARFEKVSEHFYYLPAPPGQRNTGAVITPEGILLVDPPAEAALGPALAGLKRLSPRPVRWAVATSYRSDMDGGLPQLAQQGTQIVSGADLYRLARSKEQTVDAPEPEPSGTAQDAEQPAMLPTLSFDGQVRMYPGGVEVRIISVRTKALTGADVFVYLPAEKVVYTGELFAPARLPEIDAEGGGDALGWIEAMKQIIETVPLVKSAMPVRQEAPKDQPEKKLEELIAVVPGSGPVSNLLEVKSLLETAEKVRIEVAKPVKPARDRATIPTLPALAAYRDIPGLEAFATALFDALAGPKPAK